MGRLLNVLGGGTKKTLSPGWWKPEARGSPPRAPLPPSWPSVLSLTCTPVTDRVCAPETDSLFLSLPDAPAQRPPGNLQLPRGAPDSPARRSLGCGVPPTGSQGQPSRPEGPEGRWGLGGPEHDGGPPQEGPQPLCFGAVHFHGALPERRAAVLACWSSLWSPAGQGPATFPVTRGFLRIASLTVRAVGGFCAFFPFSLYRYIT